jgi:hypothetical protein
MYYGFHINSKFLRLTLLLGFSLLLASLPLHARLGENEQELAQRFGAPIETQKIKQLDFEQRTYKKTPFLIGVTLIDGKSASEQYMLTTGKKDKAGNPALAPIAAELAQAILKANAADAEWNELEGELGKRRFLRSDKSALALFLMRGPAITEIRISSSEFNKHLTQYSKLAQ